MLQKKTNRTTAVSATSTLRRQVDDILARVKQDEGYRTQLVNQPLETLAAAGLRPQDAVEIAYQFGVGPTPNADCGKETCRLTEPCGWTVCGKTTSSCGTLAKKDMARVNPAPKIRAKQG